MICRSRTIECIPITVVECETSQPVEVVNLTGQIVVSASVNGRSLLSVPVKGVYVVRCGTSVTRVVVK